LLDGYVLTGNGYNKGIQLERRKYMEERLQKIMSHAGLGSRRTCEEIIVDGRVTVNGKVAEIGQKANPATDRIVVDGRVISGAEAPIYIIMHKPRNVLSTVEAETHDFRKTVRDLIPVEGRIYPVGRLDFDSEGLVLMTNDGDLANKLTHPKFGHLKIYRVLVARRPDNDQLATWRRGVVLEDGYKTAPADVTQEGTSGKGAWLRVVMREGRKRQIREIGSLLGLPVVRILRIALGSLRLGTLKRGEWRYLTDEEIADLKSEGPSKERKSTGRTDARPQRTRRPDGDAGRPDSRPQRTRRPDGDSGRTDSRPQRTHRPDGDSGRTDSRTQRTRRPDGDAGRTDSRPQRTHRPDGDAGRTDFQAAAHSSP
jgi:23S rRNA pseudouridine2605 synthase